MIEGIFKQMEISAIPFPAKYVYIPETVCISIKNSYNWHLFISLMMQVLSHNT